MGSFGTIGILIGFFLIDRVGRRARACSQLLLLLLPTIFNPSTDAALSQSPLRQESARPSASSPSPPPSTRRRFTPRGRRRCRAAASGSAVPRRPLCSLSHRLRFRLRPPSSPPRKRPSPPARRASPPAAASAPSRRACPGSTKPPPGDASSSLARRSPPTSLRSTPAPPSAVQPAAAWYYTMLLALLALDGSPSLRCASSKPSSS